MNEFTYEISPTMREDDGWVKCPESCADQWSLYERPIQGDENGHCLAVWIADFARKENALAFLELFND